MVAVAEEEAEAEEVEEEEAVEEQVAEEAVWGAVTKTTK